MRETNDGQGVLVIGSSCLRSLGLCAGVGVGVRAGRVDAVSDQASVCGLGGGGGGCGRGGGG